jgi:hypothetical protein
MHRRAVHVLAFLLVTQFVPPHPAAAQSAETVNEWNQALITTLSTPGASDPNIFFTRPVAMLNVAIFDAMNSFNRVYTPYRVAVDVPADASPDAAAAQAAHDVLVAMFPAQRATYDSLLATQMSRVPTGSAQRGAAVGATVAGAIVQLRADDGWNRLTSVYTLPSLAGYWQPVPPQNTAAAFVNYQDVAPFVIGSRLQFVPGPPPDLRSERYAADFNQAKALGSATSTTRTPDQTLIARLFAAVGTTTSIPAVWINLTRDLVRARALNGLDAARVYALLGTTLHDALLTSFSAKYQYGMWRATTAIREADRDDNPATIADPGWVALIPTPPYPTYPGNYACVASSATRIFARAFGRDDIPFSVTWSEANGPGWTRNYTRFTQLAEEAAMSRVYGGIHFDFDTQAGFAACLPLADYVYDNTFRQISPQ